MLKQIWEYFKAWVKGEDAELEIHKTWFFSWWEAGTIVIIIGLIIWRVWW